MQIERAIKGVKTLGPGNRMVVWVNGCHRGCPGCVSKRLQKDAPQNEQDINQYFDQFEFDDLDGMTISGGEPFDQIGELLKLIQYILEKQIFDILVYTGYTIEELNSKKDKRIEYILNHIAVLIDGPYIEALNDDTGNLKGSNNQRVIVLNKQFQQKYDEYCKQARTMQEFDFGKIIVAVGIPTREYINSFTKKED